MAKSLYFKQLLLFKYEITEEESNENHGSQVLIEF